LREIVQHQDIFSAADHFRYSHDLYV